MRNDQDSGSGERKDDFKSRGKKQKKKKGFDDHPLPIPCVSDRSKLHGFVIWGALFLLKCCSC